MASISAGQWVAIQRDGYVKVALVTEKSTVALGRDIVELAGLLGQAAWTAYSLEEAVGKSKKERRHTLKPCGVDQLEESLAEGLVDGDEGDGSEDRRDNRHIKDDGSSQRLSKEAIEGLQADGASAKQIVGHLVENSATFDQKTSFAQEKYVAKKQKKYKKCVLVRPTTYRLVLQALSTPAPQDPNPKIMGLRADSVAQIASLSGVQAGCDGATFLLFESGAQGIIVSALIERLTAESDARLVVLSPARSTSKVVAVQAMNYPPELLKKVHYFSISDFMSRVSENGLIGQPTDSATSEQLENGKRSSEAVGDGPAAKRPASNLEMELAEVVERLKEQRAASLVVVGKESPSEVCRALLPLVGFSRPLVIYSQFKEPLQEAFMALKADQTVTALKLTEPWLRRHQIMPDRTHPEVLMSGSGGFILSGVTVQPA